MANANWIRNLEMLILGALIGGLLVSSWRLQEETSRPPMRAPKISISRFRIQFAFAISKCSFQIELQSWKIYSRRCQSEILAEDYSPVRSTRVRAWRVLVG